MCAAGRAGRSPTAGRRSACGPGARHCRPRPRASPSRKGWPAPPADVSASPDPCASIPPVLWDRGVIVNRPARCRWLNTCSPGVLSAPHPDNLCRRQSNPCIDSLRVIPAVTFGRGADLAARKLVAACAALTYAALFAPAQDGVDRPPQFGVTAFGHCPELERWQELTDFAAEMNKDGGRLHFTFFISGINFIADANRAIYEGPHQRRGYSRINFGGSPDDVRRRVGYVNALYRSGHEIASHAVGHFDGATWSVSDWNKEFHAYSDILRNVGSNSGLAETALA